MVGRGEGGGILDGRVVRGTGYRRWKEGEKEEGWRRKGGREEGGKEDNRRAT